MEAARSESTQRVLGLPMGTLSYFLLFLATYDTWLTHRLLDTEQGIELNPFVDWVYRQGGGLTFVGLKIVLTSLCLIWLNRRACPTHARLAAIVALAIYLPLAGLHAVNAQFTV